MKIGVEAAITPRVNSARPVLTKSCVVLGTCFVAAGWGLGTGCGSTHHVECAGNDFVDAVDVAREDEVSINAQLRDPACSLSPQSVEVQRTSKIGSGRVPQGWCQKRT